MDRQTKDRQVFRAALAAAAVLGLATGFAAVGGDAVSRPAVVHHDPALSQVIAAQGNAAVQAIRADARAAVKRQEWIDMLPEQPAEQVATSR